MSHEPCPSCKAPVPSEEMFCPHCGDSLLPALTGREKNRLREENKSTRIGGQIIGIFLFSLVGLATLAFPFMAFGIELGLFYSAAIAIFGLTAGIAYRLIRSGGEV